MRGYMRLMEFHPMRTINKLTAKQIEAFKERGRYSDGGNLYLVITAAGTRQWVFRYRWQGKEKELVR